MVVAGNPARCICSVADYIERNLQYNAGTKGMCEKKRKATVLSLPQEKFIRK